MSKLKTPLIVIVSTVIIVLLTKHPATSPFRLHLTLLALAALIVYGFLMKKKALGLTRSKTMIMYSAIFLILLVAATGWFFSPFFFILYLLAILLGFVFGGATAIGFILTLVILFSFNIGAVDLTYDFLIVLSLLTVIPLTFYLKREYLRLKEAEKDILIIKAEEKNYQNKVEELLANRINEMAVNLRQPINDTKQLAFVMKKTHSQEEIAKDADRIIASSEEALRLVDEFEEKATGKKLLKSPA